MFLLFQWDFLTLYLPTLNITEPMVEYNVVDSGNGQRPVALVQVGKKTSKYFISETQKKAKVERQRNLLLMAVAYSANIGGTGVITGSPPNLVVPQVSIEKNI